MRTREQLVAEARALVTAAKNESRNLSTEEKTQYDVLMAEIAQRDEMRDAEERVARLESTQRNVPQGDTETREKVSGIDEIRSAMSEKRAITLSGTGAVSVISQIVKEIQQKRPLVAQYRTFYGPNASTNIPILSPGMAVPTGQAEPATASDDETAALGLKSLTPKGYMSVLPVTAEAMLLSGAAIESEIPGLFADAFGKALFSGSLTGPGTDHTMSGMFLPASVGNKIDVAVAGAPKLADLLKLALAVQDYTDDAAIVINPTHFGAMIMEDVAEILPIKQELIANRSILGVPVVLTGAAPATTVAGEIVAVSMSMSNYGLAIAQEMTIDPIKVKGDSRTYFQSTSFMNGAVILPVNSWGLVAV